MPSALSNQPSKAGVTLAPNPFGGVLGSSVCAETSAPPGDEDQRGTESRSSAVMMRLTVRSA